MSVRLFTKAERARRNRFPELIAYEDLAGFFTPSARDLDSIPRFSAAHNRLGNALQLCALCFMGCVPDDLTRAPRSDLFMDLRKNEGSNSPLLAFHINFREPESPHQ